MTLRQLKALLKDPKSQGVWLTYHGFKEAFPFRRGSEPSIKRAERLAVQCGFQLDNNPSEKRYEFKRELDDRR